MKVIVVYKHKMGGCIIIGVYTDKNRAKRGATQQDYDPDKVGYTEVELNDGVDGEWQSIQNTQL